MPKIKFKALLPHLVAVAVFLLLIFTYFPELLDNKSLRMDDVEQHKGMSNELVDYRERTGEEAIWTNAMFGGMPGYMISTVYHGNLLRYADKILKMGLPRPADSMFVLMLGMYVLLLSFRVKQPLAVLGAVVYCFSTFNLLSMEAGHMSKIDAMSYMPWVLAGLVNAFHGKRLWGALLMAVFLSLQIKATHFQITYYLFFILGFFSITYLVDSIREKTLPNFLKTSAFLVIAVLLGIVTNISSLYTIYDYGKDSIRGKSELTSKAATENSGLDASYALQYSYGVGETFSYMIPNVYGGASNLGLGEQKDALKEAEAQYKPILENLPQYWSSTSTTGPFYAGALICFLAVLGFFFVKSRIKWAILASIILAFMLAWGSNFEGFSLWMLEHFPGYNKFRAVKMTLIISDFLIPLIAVLGLSEIISNPEIIKEKKIGFFAAFGLTGGLSLLFYLMPDFFFSFDYLNPAYHDQLMNMAQQQGMDSNSANSWMDGLISSLESVRVVIFKADAIRAFLIITLGAGILFLYSRMKFNPLILAIAFLLISVADIWSVDKRYVNKKDFVTNAKSAVPFSPSQADEAVFAMELQRDPSLQPKVASFTSEGIQRAKKLGVGADEAKYRFRGLLANTDYRVLNLAANTFNDAGTSFFHKSIGGYSAVKLERYQEFIENHISANIESLKKAFSNRPTDSSLTAAMSQLYALNMLNTRYIIYNDQAPPLVNKSALGNAWFVSNIKQVESADAELSALDSSFNPATTAIIDKRFADQLSGLNPKIDSLSSIRLESYQPNLLKYATSANSDQLAIFSEIYYAKGWNAYIDGQLVPHLRANYILRGMKIPAGKHALEFRFEPETYFTTEKIGMASSGFLILLVITLLLWDIKKRNSVSEKA
ncbi:MAG TPA: YfhO family protein [Flavobacteriales bacterium]|nr:YfhO family protein [Flavobacteriales bacterium]HPH82319.1 YfhO family protein [Flavobacteriales bacterium]